MKAKGSYSLLGSPIPPYQANTREAFNRIWDALKTDNVLRKIYTSQDLRERVRASLEGADEEDFFKIWVGIANLFRFDGNSKAKIKDLVAKIHGVGNTSSQDIIIIDLSEKNVPSDIYWNDMMKLVVIAEFLERITEKAQEAYRKDELLNSLVIIDEAHRLAPKEPS